MDPGYAPLNDKTRAWILAAAKNDEDSLRRLLNENPEIYRHSSISAVSISAIFNLKRVIILAYFPPP